MFDVLPYHKATASKSSKDISIIPARTDEWLTKDSTPRTISPSVIVNTTGAWGDRTLESLGLREKQLFAGTKGSHLFTSHPPLIDALGNDGIYAEADDGRLVFILPCAGGVLIGTTDKPFADDPGNAVSTPDEIQYLLLMVAEVFPNAGLTADHVSMHQAGVRPLPRCDSKSASAIPRGYSIKKTTLNGIPITTLVGGNLTTCRSLAEEVFSRICSIQHLTRRQQTTDRPLPGAGPLSQHSLSSQNLTHLTAQHDLHVDHVAAVWPLIGDRLDEAFPHRSTEAAILPEVCVQNDSLYGTNIPKSFTKWSISKEWCTTLDDLVERRLMLIFQPTIHHATLKELAEELVIAGRLQDSQIDGEIDRVSHRLQMFYGKTVIRD